MNLEIIKIIVYSLLIGLSLGTVIGYIWGYLSSSKLYLKNIDRFFDAGIQAAKSSKWEHVNR